MIAQISAVNMNAESGNLMEKTVSDGITVAQAKWEWCPSNVLFLIYTSYTKLSDSIFHEVKVFAYYKIKIKSINSPYILVRIHETSYITYV